MIKASKSLVKFIEEQTSVESLADKWKVSRQTVYNIKNGDFVSSDIVAKIINHTGLDFEAAFEITEENSK